MLYLPVHYNTWFCIAEVRRQSYFLGNIIVPQADFMRHDVRREPIAVWRRGASGQNVRGWGGGSAVGVCGLGLGGGGVKRLIEIPKSAYSNQITIICKHKKRFVF